MHQLFELFVTLNLRFIVTLEQPTGDAGKKWRTEVSRGHD